MYQVQTWDDENKCTRYHDVTDGISVEDAEEYIKHLYPNEKLLAIIHKVNNTEYS